MQPNRHDARVSKHKFIFVLPFLDSRAQMHSQRTREMNNWWRSGAQQKNKLGLFCETNKCEFYWLRWSIRKRMLRRWITLRARSRDFWWIINREFFFFFLNTRSCVFGVWVSDAWRSLYLSEEVMVASGRSLLAALRLWLDHILSLSALGWQRRALRPRVSNARSLIFIIIGACFFTSTCRSPTRCSAPTEKRRTHTSFLLIKPIFHIPRCRGNYFIIFV